VARSSLASSLARRSPDTFNDAIRATTSSGIDRASRTPRTSSPPIVPPGAPRTLRLITHVNQRFIQELA
jgi:hypothetical protein